MYAIILNMANEINFKNELMMYYEPLILKFNTRYNRETAFEKFKKLGKRENNGSIIKEFICGNLRIDDDKLVYIPDIADFIPSSFSLYNNNYLKKLSILFSNIKSIVFYSKHTEKTITRSDEISKSYRAMSIFCYDFRVYNFYRQSKESTNAKNNIKYFNALVSKVFQPGFIKLTKDVNSRASGAINKPPSLITEQILNPLKPQTELTLNPSINLEDNEYFDVKQFSKKFTKNLAYLVNIKTNLHKIKDVELAIKNKLKAENPNEFPSYRKVDFHCKIMNPSTGEYSLDKWHIITEKEVMESYEKLYSLVTPRSLSEFKASDKKWLTKLTDTNWMSIQQKCLSNLRLILDVLMNSDDPVIIFIVSYANPLWTQCFYMSLLEIYFTTDCINTIEELNNVIYRYWLSDYRPQQVIQSSLGYSISLYDSYQLCVMLCWLDVLHQLIRSNPHKFQYTEELLIFIYDWLISHYRTSEPPIDFIKDFERIYSTEAVVTYKDPLFAQYDKEDLMNKLMDIPLLDNIDVFDSFWKKMFLRYVPYVQIKNGCFDSHHLPNCISAHANYNQEEHSKYRTSKLETTNRNSADSAMSNETTSITLLDMIYSNYPFSLNFDDEFYSPINTNIAPDTMTLDGDEYI